MNAVDGVQHRVVCAAIRHRDGRIVLGVRHFDKRMMEVVRQIGGDWRTSEQGFVDQWGEFLPRAEAWMIATDAHQIVREGPGYCGPNLFSENLY